MPDTHGQGPERGEDERERVNRELIELLNELRVALPGGQVLFAFLLTLPFTQRFTKVTQVQRAAYLVAFLAAALGVALLIAPSSYHRLRFRKGDKARMLITSNKLMIAGIGFVALSMTGVVFVITDILFGVRLASAITAVVTLWFLWFWYGLPLSRAFTDQRDDA
jgi:predicted neutral ceramidase superfamily lipid hydrolase